MNYRISDLQDKEVAGIVSGVRYGRISDLEIDGETGQVRSLTVCGRARAFGLLGHEPDLTLPWSAVRRIGTDLILIDEPQTGGRRTSRQKTALHQDPQPVQQRAEMLLQPPLRGAC